MNKASSALPIKLKQTKYLEINPKKLKQQIPMLCHRIWNKITNSKKKKKPLRHESGDMQNQLKRLLH